MIELHEFDISGNCHKVRLLLSMLKIPYQSIEVKRSEREHKSPEYLAKNPLGQVPLLMDGDICIRDSQAILVYLARTYGEDAWFPTDALKAAEIMQWLSLAANEIARGPALLRVHHLFGRAINLEEAQQTTANVLHLLNNHLSQHDWLANNTITIADIAVYPYIALANEGKVDLTPYPHVESWLGRVEMVSGFISMPGIQLHKLS